MYSYEQKKRAVELYIRYYHKAAAVIRELGYPNRHVLVQWFKEYELTGTLRRESSRIGYSKFSEEQKQAALQFYLEHGHSIKHTIETLGYPGKTTFKLRLNEAYPDRKKYCVSGGAMVEFPQEKKEQAVIDLCARAGSAREIAESHGVSRVTLYEWKKQLLSGEDHASMATKKHVSCQQYPTETKEDLLNKLSSLQAEVASKQELLNDLEREVYRLRLERDILEKAGQVLKKDRGISLTALTNREKTIVIDALRGKYSLCELLSGLCIAKSSYCYQSSAMRREDKYSYVRQRIVSIFAHVQKRYGYRRIHCLLKNESIIVSEKVVRRIMREESLVVPSARMKKYSSYVGEVSPAVKDLVKRDFHADAPNKRWLTDITEFQIQAGKIYLSPMIDCYDGLPVAWTIGTSPSAELANTMLDSAISTLGPDDHPIVHSDRGGHYRWSGWIERMEKANLIRSMSRKGCSPDNAACEGFHGRLKNEFFYGRDWRNVSVSSFISLLDEYLHWYCEERIKMSLGGMSPLQFRRAHGLVCSANP